MQKYQRDLLSKICGIDFNGIAIDAGLSHGSGIHASTAPASGVLVGLIG